MPEVAITRLKPRRGVRPVTLEEALLCWYLGGANADSRLSVRAKMLLHLLCGLASGKDGEDLAPMPYSVEEIARRLKRPVDATRRAAEEAAAAGYVELNGKVMILTEPRSRAVAADA